MRNTLSSKTKEGSLTTSKEACNIFVEEKERRMERVAQLMYNEAYMHRKEAINNNLFHAANNYHVKPPLLHEFLILPQQRKELIIHELRFYYKFNFKLNHNMNSKSSIR